MKKPRIAHTQEDCPIRKRYQLPVSAVFWARLTRKNTKVGETTVVECRYCYLRRIRKAWGLVR